MSLYYQNFIQKNFLPTPFYGVGDGLTVGLTLGAGVEVIVGLSVGLISLVGEAVGVAVVLLPVSITISNELVSSRFAELIAIVLKVGFNTVAISFTISSKLVRPVTVVTVLSYVAAFADLILSVLYPASVRAFRVAATSGSAHARLWNTPKKASAAESPVRAPAAV